MQYVLTPILSPQSYARGTHRNTRLRKCTCPDRWHHCRAQFLSGNHQTCRQYPSPSLCSTNGFWPPPLPPPPSYLLMTQNRRYASFSFLPAAAAQSPTSVTRERGKRMQWRQSHPLAHSHGERQQRLHAVYFIRDTREIQNSLKFYKNENSPSENWSMSFVSWSRTIP